MGAVSQATGGAPGEIRQPLRTEPVRGAWELLEDLRVDLYLGRAVCDLVFQLLRGHHDHLEIAAIDRSPQGVCCCASQQSIFDSSGPSSESAFLHFCSILIGYGLALPFDLAFLFISRPSFAARLYVLESFALNGRRDRTPRKRRN